MGNLLDRNRYLILPDQASRGGHLDGLPGLQEARSGAHPLGGFTGSERAEPGVSAVRMREAVGTRLGLNDRVYHPSQSRTDESGPGRLDHRAIVNRHGPVIPWSRWSGQDIRKPPE